MTLTFDIVIDKCYGFIIIGYINGAMMSRFDQFTQLPKPLVTHSLYGRPDSSEYMSLDEDTYTHLRRDMLKKSHDFTLYGGQATYPTEYGDYTPGLTDVDLETIDKYAHMVENQDFSDLSSLLIEDCQSLRLRENSNFHTHRYVSSSLPDLSRETWLQQGRSFSIRREAMASVVHAALENDQLNLSPEAFSELSKVDGMDFSYGQSTMENPFGPTSPGVIAQTLNCNNLFELQARMYENQLDHQRSLAQTLTPVQHDLEQVRQVGVHTVNAPGVVGIEAKALNSALSHVADSKEALETTRNFTASLKALSAHDDVKFNLRDMIELDELTMNIENAGSNVPGIRGTHYRQLATPRDIFPEKFASYDDTRLRRHNPDVHQRVEQPVRESKPARDVDFEL